MEEIAAPKSYETSAHKTTAIYLNVLAGGLECSRSDNVAL